MSDSRHAGAPAPTAPSAREAAAAKPQSSDVAVDGMCPREVDMPADGDELCIALARANHNGSAVIAIGGGAHLGLGNLPERYDRAVVTRCMDQIVAYDPADVTVTVQAGMLLDALQAVLAEHGQFLPLDPPGRPGATIGGALAANLQGPLRGAYGTPRDWVVGMRIVLAGGQAISSGGRVVKNVTGYDLHKLHIGALGTLGVISEVSFKLALAPRIDRTVCAVFDSARSAAAFLGDAQGRGLALLAWEVLSPSAAAVLAGAPSWAALVRLGGGPNAVERSLRDLGALARTHGAPGLADSPLSDPWQAWRLLFAPDALALRISVPPRSAAAVAQSLHDELAVDAPMISLSAAAGLVRVKCDNASAGDETLKRVGSIAARAGGWLAIDSAPAPVKATCDVFGAPRADIAIMRRIKHEYDPHRTLSPGRFYGRL